ncbi:NhaP-type Na+(K+)/H+ antiporter [Belliella baltica DSM 15883]|uniref:NhaP-type Na+(K+)/H+ antiporter n=1 Tax=Belliella baltica (strain DSM 15883 / CIP 108006 / LMG 21964 / BA134) TaxID=866536 RepID=I3Z8P4_BELBD|nr:potassium/proton antiporter [Belliella baltica]AFL85612.1 NhaP-type Na+(K+)/H+ antiporter [Belliella baltica DSM 15883]
MNLTIENILFIGSILLFLSILAGKTSYKFGVPTLVLFLLIGMIAGSDGLGIQFNNPEIAQFIGIVSLNFILFSGGLDTNWKSIKPVLGQGIALSTIGEFLTAASLGVFVWAISDFSIYEGLLLGAIVSSTDAAAVFSILRSKSLALKYRLRSTLELESGSNDPMAYVMTIAFLGLVINPNMGFLSLIVLFFQQMILGAVLGLGFGWLSKIAVNKINLGFEGLYPVLVISLMFITFSFTDLVGGNGFLAVYLCAVYLGNQELIHKKTILRMFDGIAWLMQIVLFLTLGLLVNPTDIIPLLSLGLAASAFLIFVSRPFGVFMTLLPFKMKIRRKWYISWVGLRGAVPIVFATYPLIAGIEKAHTIFNIVFFISLTSVLVQGTTLSVVARWLKVALPEKLKPKNPIDYINSESPKTAMAEIDIPENHLIVGKKILDLGFPKNAIIAMLRRKGEFITPSGNTEILANDQLLVLAENELSLSNVYKTLGILQPETEDEEQ